jgi:type I restriction enzyme R subunit
VRLFRLRLEKRLLLRGRGEDDSAVVQAMQRMLSTLPLDNVNIRPHHEAIRSLLAAWPAPDEATSRRLSQTIAPLLRYYWAVNLSEIQFRVLVERITVVFLAEHQDEVTRLSANVCEAVEALADTIQEVQAVAEKRAWVLSEGFWSHLDVSRLDDLQDTFAPLMRFRQSNRSAMIELPLPDHIASRRWIIYGPSGEGAFADSYREQVEAHVRRLAEELPALTKLKRGEELHETDLSDIARTLNQADLFITEDILREVYQQPAASLPDFMRHSLAIAKLPTSEDRIQAEFERFIANHGFLSASQINFLRGVRAAVLRHAKISHDQLRKPPLSRVGAVEILFKPQEIEDIINFANRLAEQVA